MLIDVLRCGICGSDLHARLHCDELAEVAREAGYEDFMRSDQDVVMGHEFCGEVRRARARLAQAVAGGRARSWRCRCCAPAGGVHAIGLSAAAPGAYAEQMLVQESLTRAGAERPAARRSRR